MMRRFITAFGIERLRRDERGSSMVEYVIILSLIGVATIGFLAATGEEVADEWRPANQTFRDPGKPSGRGVAVGGRGGGSAGAAVGEDSGSHGTVGDGGEVIPNDDEESDEPHPCEAGKAPDTANCEGSAGAKLNVPNKAMSELPSYGKQVELGP